MAATSEISPGPSVEQVEDGADGKLEKKRKFKPFEAMKKFFRASRKRSKLKDGDNVNIVSLKAKSTSELSSQQIDEEDNDADDDGGFKTSTHKTLVPTRSISEDSIFKPDPKDAKKSKIEPFAKGAKSVENINQNFKSELANKLKKRQSFHSDDDGLPKSPMSSFTTADIVNMGGGLKGAPSRSASRGSDKSLLSVDGSENEEEDLFQTNWRAGVASVVTRKKPASQTDSSMDLDLSAVQPTVALKSDAAKHRISVAPPRRSGLRQGKKAHHQKVSNASALPRLNEESPTKVGTEGNVLELELSPPPVSKEVVLETSQVVVKTDQEEKKQGDKPEKTIPAKPTMAQSTPIPIPGADKAGKVPVSRMGSGGHSEDETVKGSNSSVSPPVSKSAPAEERVKPELFEKRADSSSPQKSSTENSELSQAFSKLKKTSVTKTVEDTSHDSDKENAAEEPAVEKPTVPEIERSKSPTQQTQDTLQISDSEKSQGALPNKTKTLSETNNKADKKPGNVSKLLDSTSNSSDKPSFLVVKEPLRPTLSAPVQNSPNTTEGSVSTNIVTAESSSSPPKDVSVKFKDVEAESSIEAKDSGKIIVGSGLQRLASPKEDYKMKRHGRSKTLPEQPLAKEIMIEKSAAIEPRNEYDNVTFIKNKPQITEGSSKEAASSVPSRPVSTIITAAARRPEPKRLSLKGDSDSSEPIWVVMARKKQTEREEKESSVTKDEKMVTDMSKKPTETEPVMDTKKSSPVTSQIASFKISKSENSAPSKSPPSQTTEIQKSSPKTGRVASFVKTSKPESFSRTKSPPPQVTETQKSSPVAGRVASFKTSKAETSVKTSKAETSIKTSKVETAPIKLPPSQTTETQKSSPVAARVASFKTSKADTTVLSKTSAVQSKATSNTSASIVDTKTTPKVSVSDTKTPSKVPSTDTKLAPKFSFQEAKSSVQDNTNSSKTTETAKSVSTNKPPVTFLRNSQDSKAANPTMSTSKPSLGKSFTIEKSATPVVKSFTIEKSTVNKGNTSTPGRSFSIEKPLTGTMVPSNINASGVKIPATTTEKTEKKDESKGSNVPAWRSNLQKKKDVMPETHEMKTPEQKKIEIIEKSETVNTQQKPPQLKSPEKKGDEKTPVILREKTKTEKCSDLVSSRSSKVLDLVKNYQKLQVS